MQQSPNEPSGVSAAVGSSRNAKPARARNRRQRTAWLACGRVHQTTLARWLRARADVFLRFVILEGGDDVLERKTAVDDSVASSGIYVAGVKAGSNTSEAMALLSHASFGPAPLVVEPGDIRQRPAA